MPEIQTLTNSTLLYIQYAWVAIWAVGFAGFLTSTNDKGSRKKSIKDVALFGGVSAIGCFISAFMTAVIFQVGFTVLQAGGYGVEKLSQHPLSLLIALFSVTYFLPCIIALTRSHKKLVGISLLNLLAGWTVIGWIAAFIWAWIDTNESKAIS